MTPEQLDAYDRLLDENDWDIYYWATQTGQEGDGKVGLATGGEGEWAQTVGRKKEPYRQPPDKWNGSEILEMLRRHVKERAAGTDGVEKAGKGLGRMPDVKTF
jgi:succinate dehydrogenase assembly factor 2